jgi:hypothetical protein
MYAYSLPTVITPTKEEVLPEQIEEEVPKTTEQIIAEEAQNLEKPTESVAYLQYMMKHAEKVNVLQKRLHSFSKSLCAVSVLIAGYAAMCYFTAETVASTPKPHGKLQASH